jgi:hypothetical protein
LKAAFLLNLPARLVDLSRGLLTGYSVEGNMTCGLTRSSRWNKVHVFIVDPHPDVRDVIQMGYRSEHIWRTTCAADADEATSAVQLARKLTAMNIPVLIMTGVPEQQQRLIDARCPFIAKPFSVSQLLDETRLLLSCAEQRKAALADSLDRTLSADEDFASAEEARKTGRNC